METTIEITLTKDRAEFLCQELNVWSVEARLINVTDNWATVEVTGKDAENADTFVHLPLTLEQTMDVKTLQAIKVAREDMNMNWTPKLIIKLKQLLWKEQN